MLSLHDCTAVVNRLQLDDADEVSDHITRAELHSALAESPLSELERAALFLSVYPGQPM